MAQISLASYLANLPVACFIENVAAKSPAPGGGSVAALSGALGAGLGAMVCRLTIGKKKYKDVEDELRAAEEKLAPLVEKLRDLVDEDTFAFNRVMAAFDLPQSTDEEKASRQAAVDQATLEAAAVPFTVMQAADAALGALTVVAEKGNLNSVSDAGVAALSLSTCFHGARMNVEINLKDLPASGQKAAMVEGIAGMAGPFDVRCAQILGIVAQRMHG
ncbi:cyclodeaminase/cyclohydrolase family protein [Myxococcota bacterium]|nr:cyclodeaminase/cyclohydrolase family protein [Myxococcota bacterium]MBU1412911.1 cyclodeaminase/cyclohydrolase family protein [Myxococcota bacterium]MBU1511198.1 cyclodeaminase/cyclohydrolase family protein [Myxococcota bacterium]